MFLSMTTNPTFPVLIKYYKSDLSCSYQRLQIRAAMYLIPALRQSLARFLMLSFEDSEIGWLNSWCSHTLTSIVSTWFLLNLPWSISGSSGSIIVCFWFLEIYWFTYHWLIEGFFLSLNISFGVITRVGYVIVFVWIHTGNDIEYR